MLRLCVALLYFTAAMAYGQSRTDLLRRAANFYKDQGSFDVKGEASAKVPGSSWQLTYDVETEGAQPRFIPLGLRRDSLQAVTSVGNLRTARVIADATDQLPGSGISMRPFAQYTTLADHLIDAQRVGIETVTYQGRDYQCEVIDATYDTSPDFKPGSASSHRKIFIDPETLWVLKETAPDRNVGEWSFVVKSIVFNQQPSQALIQSLEKFANPRSSRPEWQGRDAPDFALNDIPGNRVRLSDLRGHAILLDFWGSYCAPCKRAAALSEQIASEYRDAGLVVWGMTQDTPADARSWLSFNHLSLPSLLDPDGVAFKAFEVEGVPVAILIDQQGKVVKYWESMDDKGELETAVKQILSPRR